jgi:intracellular sulfur oxidation DsrE/DsrF family protein
MKYLKGAFFSLWLLWPAMASALTVDTLLEKTTAPAGVVFEVVQGNRDALEWAIPLIGKDASRLRERFPGLAIAVVTHGAEQFALTRDNRERSSVTHAGVMDLVQDQDIPVHVCGTHASWFDIMPEDFPEYIDVPPSGPAQIRAYRDLGYELVLVRKPR